MKIAFLGCGALANVQNQFLIATDFVFKLNTVIDVFKTGQRGERERDKDRSTYLHCSSLGQRSPLQISFDYHWRCIPGPLGMGSLGARFSHAARSSWMHWKAEEGSIGK